MINVTPLIDVLLVLLIIFMVIVPAHSVGLPVRAPMEDKLAAPATARTLVITVLNDGGVVMNRNRMAAGEWPDALRRIMAMRADKTVFFTAAPDMEFRLVGVAIDQARAAGAGQVGLLGKTE